VTRGSEFVRRLPFRANASPVWNVVAFRAIGWGLGTVTDRHRHDLLEIREDVMTADRP
jgi:hypothetical protein